MVHEPPSPPPSESMGVEDSISGSEKMAGMEKNEVKKSIDVCYRQVRCVRWCLELGLECSGGAVRTVFHYTVLYMKTKW